MRLPKPLGSKIRRRLPMPSCDNFLASKVRGESTPFPVFVDLDEQCHHSRPVAMAALGGSHRLPMDVE
ncbi:MAG: hypothetical protein ACKPKO_63680, partial [Candidatus Fonsibacter sp.]